MEKRGYLFAQWASPNQIVFREAAEEIAFRKRVIFSDECAVFATGDQSPRGFQYVQFVPEGIAISPMREVVFPVRLVRSFSLWERRLGIASSAQWACVTVEAGIEDAPPPLHYLFPLYTEWEVKRFNEAMAQMEVAELPQRTYPELVWHWTTFNRAGCGLRLMGFGRKKRANAAMDRFAAVAEAEDPIAFDVATRGLLDWARFYPDLSRRIGESGPPPGGVERPIVEGYIAAQALRAAVKAGDPLDGILNEQVSIFQAQAIEGMSKEWAIGLMFIRCFAIGTMLGELGMKDEAVAFAEMFGTLVEEAGLL